MTDKKWDADTYDIHLDTCGLSCPLPLLKAKLELNRLAGGAVLRVYATDSGSQRDFRAFASMAGHQLLREEVEGEIYKYWLRKG
ncbi:sulfurtransferase TusA family protein [Ectopseudomonas mendocina]|uniref:Sulfurtransferase TusA family protein n=1 Tax=Ectopseudomonas mendocina TaxID=300 RepID=A0ABZ2RFE7_ECTME